MDDGADVSAAEYRSVTGRKSVNGTYLNGTVLQSHYVQTLTECLHHCARNCPYCGSVNAQVIDGTAGGQMNGWWNCELNGDDGNATLTMQPGWEFYDVYVTRCR